MPTPIDSMRIVARRLTPLDVSFAFLGGAVIPLQVDHAELTEIRPTKDVDVVVEAVTYQEFTRLEEKLRFAGFQHEMARGAPICRWRIEGCLVDIMPMDPSPLGMNTKWFREALDLARLVDLGEGCAAKIVTPPLFLATKLEAFYDRGKGDFFASHDLEDIVTVVDGRRRIVEDVRSAPKAVREFIQKGFGGLLKNPDFRDAFTGHLSGLTGARQRAPLVMGRFEAIAEEQGGQ